jgi:hypothetical protein
MRKVLEFPEPWDGVSPDVPVAAHETLERLIAERVAVRKFQGEGGRPIGRIVRRVDDPVIGDFVGVLRTPSGSEVYVDVRNLAYLEAPLAAQQESVFSR